MDGAEIGRRGHFNDMPAKTTAKYDLVHIVWHDAAMHGTGQVWIGDVGRYGIIKGHVAGWLVQETKTHVTIGMDYFPSDNRNDGDSFRTLQSYPKSGIEKMVRVKTLKVLEKKSKKK